MQRSAHLRQCAFQHAQVDGAHDFLIRFGHLSEGAAVKQDPALPGFLHGLRHESKFIEERGSQ
jgi:hypothetical protein